MEVHDREHADLLRRAEAVNRTSRALHRVWAKPERDGAWPKLRRAGLGRQTDHVRAVAEFRSAMDAMYPDAFMANMGRLRQGDRAGIEDGLLFLEADPWCFRSGYVKERLVRYLRHVALTEDERERLERVLVDVLRRRPRREFREYCRTARALDSASLRQRIDRARDETPEDDALAWRARTMLEVMNLPGTRGGSA